MIHPCIQTQKQMYPGYLIQTIIVHVTMQSQDASDMTVISLHYQYSRQKYPLSYMFSQSKQ